MLQWLLGKRKAHLPANYKKSLDPEAVDIVRRLRQAGFETYLVGGVVRDILAGIAPKDFDIATKATPQQVKHIIKRSFIIGKRFRIVVAKRRQSVAELQRAAHELFPLQLARMPEREYQITTFRREPEKKGEEINENVFGDPREDALRRDFTVNGLFLEPDSGKILDYVGGVEDAHKQRLRVIGNAHIRLREDPIRILRAVRMMVKVGLQPDPDLKNAIHECVPVLADAKKERVREELLKLLREGTAAQAFELYSRFGIWPQLSTEFAKLLQGSGVEARARHVWQQLKNTPWKNPQHAAPLFYLLFCVPLELLDEERIDHPRLLRLCEHFKVFRAESEEMLRIAHTLARLKRDPDGHLSAHRVLSDNPRHVASQVQSFYVFKVLADAGIAPFPKLWSNWQHAWQQHLKFVQKFSEPRFSAAGPGVAGAAAGGPPRDRRRRRRGGRGRRPPPTGT